MDDKVKETAGPHQRHRLRSRRHRGGHRRVAGRKAGQMVDVAKLNVQLFDLNGEFSDILKKLGQVMYDTHRGQGGESADVAGLLERADEVSEKIREVKARISDLRQSRTCPACGASCGKEDKYCRGCGAPL